MDSLKIATLVSLSSIEAAIVDGANRRATFENSSKGIARFQAWALSAYSRGSDIDVLLWEAEPGVGATAFGEQAPAGKIMFRSLLPWRSANGNVSVDYAGYASAVEFCRRFGYEDVKLEGVIRRANGEYPRLNTAG